MGVAPNHTTCVVYSDDAIYAARLWFVLSLLGADVRYLDGGLQAWMQSGGSVDTVAHDPTPAPPCSLMPSAGCMWQPRLELLVTTNAVEHDAGDMILADMRSWSEFLGHTSGYRYLSFAGRVPGARWGGDAVEGVFTNPNGTLLPLAEVALLWTANLTAQLDVSRLVFYCGNGYRASLALLYAVLLQEAGYGDAALAHTHGYPRLYSSGWSQWGTVFIRAPNSTVPPTPGWVQVRSDRRIESGPAHSSYSV